MNNKNLLIGAIALSNISLQAGYIDDEFTVQVGTNQALAQDMEIITVEGRRFTPPNYSTALQSSNVDYDSDQSRERERRQDEMRRDREGLCRLQPDGCDPHNPPSIEPNGCSTEFAGVDFYNEWDAVFVGACNQHDVCYTDPNSSFDSCNEELRQDTLDICSAKNEEAANNGTFFNVSECWDKSSEYYAGVQLFGMSYFEEAKQNSSCVAWIEVARSSNCWD